MAKESSVSTNNCDDDACSCNGVLPPREWEEFGIEAIARPRTERLGTNPVHTGLLTASSIAMASNRLIVADTATETEIMVNGQGQRSRSMIDRAGGACRWRFVVLPSSVGGSWLTRRAR